MHLVRLIDFGSTYTKVTAVDIEAKRLVGTAQSFTTIETDINEGLSDATARLLAQCGQLEFCESFACSSAAGGLRMMVSGLVAELTAEAARNAALGAGAKVIRVFSHELTDIDLSEIERAKPDIFLLTGGTDGGNQTCIVQNAKAIATLKVRFPVLIAGNRSASEECAKYLADFEVIRTDNVMPRLGELHIDKVQGEIRDLFLKRIIKAKGLSTAQTLVNNILMPTPTAVLQAMKLLANGTRNQDGIGEIIGIDVGGATTDVYSIASGDPDGMNVVLKGLPEPYAKRTVEGDLGMRYSLEGVIEAVGIEEIAKLAKLRIPVVEELVQFCLANKDIIPSDDEHKAFDYAVASSAVAVAARRHAGRLEACYTPLGQVFAQTGKDLTRVKKLVVTGGSLIRTSRASEIARHALNINDGPLMLLPKEAEVLVDRKYILAAMGVLKEHYPDVALEIMKGELIYE